MAQRACARLPLPLPRPAGAVPVRGCIALDLATPAYGYYYGAGVQWRNLLRGVDLSLDVRYGDKIARDNLLPSDPPQDPRPDTFYDLTGATLSLSYHW